ncbi:MAG: VPLPA-CTERM sorting domain-containing protein [Gammaproteobacteria bacterium]|nr:VPLPA-CTERM sorting domain-containing protein [Gammaproteobacteria bacterium]
MLILRSFNHFILIGLALLGLSVSSANAATLTGDQVTVDLLPTAGDFTSSPIGAGFDLSVGVFRFDFNGGVDGDEFLFEDNGGFFSNSNSILLSTLDFDDGSDLLGFDLISTSLSNLTFSFTANSLTFNFDLVPGSGPNNGPAIHGRFITDVSPVPVPAAVWLFGTALLGFVGMSRRRKVA